MKWITVIMVSIGVLAFDIAINIVKYHYFHVFVFVFLSCLSSEIFCTAS